MGIIFGPMDPGTIPLIALPPPAGSAQLQCALLSERSTLAAERIASRREWVRGMGSVVPTGAYDCGTRHRGSLVPTGSWGCGTGYGTVVPTRSLVPHHLVCVLHGVGDLVLIVKHCQNSVEMIDSEGDQLKKGDGLNFSECFSDSDPSDLMVLLVRNDKTLLLFRNVREG